MRFPRGWQAADETTVLATFEEDTTVLDDISAGGVLISADVWRERAEGERERANQEQIRAEAAEADLKDANAEINRLQREYDDLSVRAILLPARTDWTEVAPEPPEQPLPQPVHGTWTPPPPTDWDSWTGSVGD